MAASDLRSIVLGAGCAALFQRSSGGWSSGLDPTGVTMLAVRILLTQTAILGPQGSGAWPAIDPHRSTTTSPRGWEQHTNRLPMAGFSSGAGR